MNRIIAITFGSALVLALGLAASHADYHAKKEYIGKAALNNGQPFGDGECVELVRQQTGAPETAKWKKGAQVRGNKNITAGTAIATFNKDGKYEGRAAMYQSQDANGIHVLDQWKGQIPHNRHIRFQGGKAHRISNDGDAFYVIQ